MGQPRRLLTFVGIRSTHLGVSTSVLHAKTALIDRHWSTVGTANFDYCSFFVNNELNLFTEDASFNAELAAQFACDLSVSREVTAAPWRHRRWRAPVAEAIGWWARRWL